MKPATVKRWHTQGWRLHWRWRSKRRGRPPLDLQMRGLIRQLSREKPLWSAEGIRDTLLLPGYAPPCGDTIRKYMARSRKPRQPSSTWLPFLRNHLDVSWAIDFFTVTTLSFATVYVFLVFERGRRRVTHLAVTRSPSMQWVIQHLREAMPFGRQPRYLFRDNDGIYGRRVALFLGHCDIREVHTALQSPWQNPYVERFIGTLRRELLDHVIVLNESHLQRLLGEFIEDYYHVARPHQGLGGDTSFPTESPLVSMAPPRWSLLPSLAACTTGTHGLRPGHQTPAWGRTSAAAPPKAAEQPVACRARTWYLVHFRLPVGRHLNSARGHQVEPDTAQKNRSDGLLWRGSRW